MPSPLMLVKFGAPAPPARQRLRAEHVAGQPLERAADDDASPRQRERAGELELRAPGNTAVGLVAVVHAADGDQEIRIGRGGRAGVRDRAVGGRSAEESRAAAAAAR